MRRIGSLIASTPYAFSPSSRPPSDRMDRNSGHGQPLKTPSAPSIYSFTQDSSAQGMGSSSPPTPTNSTRAWRRHSASTVSPPSSPSSSNSSKGTLRPSSVSYSFQSKSKGIQRSNSRTLGTWEGETRPAFKSEATPANILYQFMDPNSPTGILTLNIFKVTVPSRISRYSQYLRLVFAMPSHRYLSFVVKELTNCIQIISNPIH